LRRGEVEDAQRDMEASLPGLSNNANGWVRYELGKLALEAQDFQTAQRYFKSLEVYNQALLQITAQVEFYLGETYEGLGDEDEARLHYARFVNWWEEADPELQPWVDRARQALERLTREAA
jgi:tetratricopeptide (TPR) repeat protein